MSQISMLIETIEYVDGRLDEDVAEEYKHQPLGQDWARVSKVIEEAGEAIDALIGITGQNPRKGKYGEIDDLLDELADVALTGIYAIQHFVKDGNATWQRVLARAQWHRTRIQPSSASTDRNVYSRGFSGAELGDC